MLPLAHSLAFAIRHAEQFERWVARRDMVSLVMRNELLSSSLRLIRSYTTRVPHAGAACDAVAVALRFAVSNPQQPERVVALERAIAELRVLLRDAEERYRHSVGGGTRDAIDG